MNKKKLHKLAIKYILDEPLTKEEEKFIMEDITKEEWDFLFTEIEILSPKKA